MAISGRRLENGNVICYNCGLEQTIYYVWYRPSCSWGMCLRPGSEEYPPEEDVVIHDTKHLECWDWPDCDTKPGKCRYNPKNVKDDDKW